MCPLPAASILPPDTCPPVFFLRRFTPLDSATISSYQPSLMHIDAASKKRAARASLSDIEGGGFVTTGGPDSAYWYHQHSQWARTSAFKPWSPVLLKERMAASKLPPRRAAACRPPDSARLPQAQLGLPCRSVLKKGAQIVMDVVPKKEHVPTACSRSLELASGGVAPAGKLVNGRLSADTEETMSNSSLSTLSGVEDVGMAEDGKEGATLVAPELQGLWVAFERHSLGERARQDIMHEVSLLLSACQQRHFIASYKLLLQQRQEAEPMPPCKLGSMAKGGDMPSPRRPPPTSAVPTSPPNSTHQPPTASSPEAAPHGSPVNSHEDKELSACTPQPPLKPPVEQHKMLLTA
ncbi:hypothetical protein MRX96_028668 [Rhipicephalus microplus]